MRRSGRNASPKDRRCRTAKALLPWRCAPDERHGALSRVLRDAVGRTAIAARQAMRALCHRGGAWPGIATCRSQPGPQRIANSAPKSPRPRGQGRATRATARRLPSEHPASAAMPACQRRSTGTQPCEPPAAQAAEDCRGVPKPDPSWAARAWQSADSLRATGRRRCTARFVQPPAMRGSTTTSLSGDKARNQSSR